MLNNGCKTNKPSYNRLDLVGKKFSQLIVLAFSGVQKKHRESLWLCKCDCGKETITTGYQLTSGNTKSCGCLRGKWAKDTLMLPTKIRGLNRIFSDYRKTANRKGRIFSLTKIDVKNLITADCYYCGNIPTNSFNLSENRHFIYQGIDRLDNNKGYTTDNVVPCCIVCNKMKKAMSYNDFISHIRRIALRFNKTPQV